MGAGKVAVPGRRGVLLGIVGLLVLVGCTNTPSYLYDVSRSPAPLREPPPDQPCEGATYEDRLTGGQVFSMYCGYCHNVRPLAERPFSSYQNVALHMRVRANLTGKEYAKLLAFFREVQDVPAPTPPVGPSPKRFFFDQPIAELRPQAPPNGGADKQQPAAQDAAQADGLRGPALVPIGPAHGGP
jgi:hypothetical protein